MLNGLSGLYYGFGIALSLQNLLYCWVGALLGTMVGVLPGIGPITTVALLLPLTFKISATSAIIMLAGIYYGATHAESTTAIMLNTPAGHPAAIVICFDGHPMAKQGRAGPALCMAALSSFFAGSVCVVLITLASPVLGRVALSFGAPEYATAIMLALSGISLLSRESALNTMGMAVMGLALGTVGTDVSTGITRFTMGDFRLGEGISFMPVTIALFALVEIASTLGAPEAKLQVATKARDLIPTWVDLKACVLPVLRGTVLGGALGVLPGTGPLMASFASYVVEKKSAKEPHRFGNGAIEGVAAPEAAANAAAITNFIPMLSLGIPAGPIMALLLGALMMQGIPPGPRLMVDHADLYWGLIASMWIGNLMLLALNLPLIGVWIKLLQTPYRLLYPMIILFCVIGVYSERNESFDILVCAVVLAIGWVLEGLDCPPGPLIFGMILGPTLEENLRRSLLISHGDVSVFVTRPISLGFVVLTAIVVGLLTLPPVIRLARRPKADQHSSCGRPRPALEE